MYESWRSFFILLIRLYRSRNLLSYCTIELRFYLSPFFFFPGEVVSIPLPRTVTSIWPLPFGLLLQAVEGNPPTQVPFSSSNPFLSERDISRFRRDSGHSRQNNYSYLSAYSHMIKGDTTSLSSHLILSDLLEEPMVVL